MSLTIGNRPGGLVVVPPFVTVSITTEGCAAQCIGDGCGLTGGRRPHHEQLKQWSTAKSNQIARKCQHVGYMNLSCDNKYAVTLDAQKVRAKLRLIVEP